MIDLPNLDFSEIEGLGPLFLSHSISTVKNQRVARAFSENKRHLASSFFLQVYNLNVTQDS